MKTNQKEVEFALRLFKLLNQTLDLIFEKYGKLLITPEENLNDDDYLEEDIPF